jgi:hypothetical protein
VLPPGFPFSNIQIFFEQVDSNDPTTRKLLSDFAFTSFSYSIEKAAKGLL